MWQKRIDETINTEMRNNRSDRKKPFVLADQISYSILEDEWKGEEVLDILAQYHTEIDDEDVEWEQQMCV